MKADNDNIRIDNTTAVFMTIVAGFFDLLSAVPGMNYISLIFGNGVIILWLWLRGVKFFGVKKSAQKIITMGTQWLIEAIPLLSIAPGLTVSVIIIIAITKTEDTVGVNPLDSSDTIKNNRIGDARKRNTSVNDNMPKKNKISRLGDRAQTAA